MHLIHLVYKRPCFLQKNTAVQVLRQGLKTNKQEQETANKNKKNGEGGNLVHKNAGYLKRDRRDLLTYICLDEHFL